MEQPAFELLVEEEPSPGLIRETGIALLRLAADDRGALTCVESLRQACEGSDCTCRLGLILAADYHDRTIQALLEAAGGERLLVARVVSLRDPAADLGAAFTAILSSFPDLQESPWQMLCGDAVRFHTPLRAYLDLLGEHPDVGLVTGEPSDGLPAFARRNGFFLKHGEAARQLVIRGGILHRLLPLKGATASDVCRWMTDRAPTSLANLGFQCAAIPDGLTAVDASPREPVGEGPDLGDPGRSEAPTSRPRSLHASSFLLGQPDGGLDAGVFFVGTLGQRTALRRHRRGMATAEARCVPAEALRLLRATALDTPFHRALQFYPTASLTRAYGDLRYLDPSGGDQQAGWFSLEETEELELALDSARAGANAPSIARALTDSPTELDREAADGFVRELIQAAVLVPDLSRMCSQPSSLPELVRLVADMVPRGPLARRLVAAARLFPRRERPVPEALTAYRRLQETLVALPSLLTASLAIQHKRPPTLAEDQVRELEGAVHLLLCLQPSPKRQLQIESFRSRFCEVYGAKEVPLLEALNRLRFPEERPPRAAAEFDRRRFLLARLTETLAADDTELRLQSADVEALADEEWRDTPTAARAGVDFWQSAAGRRFFVRFVDRADLPTQGPGDAPFALLDPWGPLRPDRPSVSEVLASVRDGRVSLRSSVTGVSIAPAPELAARSREVGTHPLFQFLTAVANDGVLGRATWTWCDLSSAPYLPRVTLGRCLLARASWRVTPNLLRRLECGHFGNLSRLLIFEDRTFDLDARADVRELLRRARTAPRSRLEEALPAGGEGATKRSAGGGFLWLELMSSAQEPTARLDSRPLVPHGLGPERAPVWRRTTETLVDMVFAGTHCGSPRIGNGGVFVDGLARACSRQGLHFVHCCTHDQAERMRDAIESGRLRVRCLINYLRSDPSFRSPDRLPLAVKDRGGIVLNDPEGGFHGDKAYLHAELAKRGVDLPKTIIWRRWQSFDVLVRSGLEELGAPWVCKSSSGGGGRDLVISLDARREDLEELRLRDPKAAYLVQEFVRPAVFGRRPAWFRVYYCMGAVFPSFQAWTNWPGQESSRGTASLSVSATPTRRVDPSWIHSATATEVSRRDRERYGLRPLDEITRILAEISGFEFFSCEIAVVQDQGRLRFLPIDYMNNLTYMRTQSEVGPKGIPDRMAHRIARHLAATLARSSPRARTGFQRQFCVRRER